MDYFSKKIEKKLNPIIFKKMGEKAIYKPHDGESYKINVVYSDQYYEVDAMGNSLNSRQKSVYVSLKEMKKSPEENKDKIIVRGNEYTIKSCQEEDSVAAVMFLKEFKNMDSILDELDTSMKDELGQIDWRT